MKSGAALTATSQTAPTDSGEAAPAPVTSGTKTAAIWPGDPRYNASDANQNAVRQAALKYINAYSSSAWLGAASTPQSLAAVMGVDYTSAQQQYQSYVSNFKQAQARVTGYGAGAPHNIAQPMTLSDFIRATAQGSYGIWAPAVDMLAYTWQNEYGAAMPQAVAQQLSAALNQLAQTNPTSASDVQQQMLSAMEAIETAAKSSTGASGQAQSLNLNLEIQPFLQQLQADAPAVYTAASSAGGAPASTSVWGQAYANYASQLPSVVAGTAATEKETLQTNAIDFLAQYGLPATSANIDALASADAITNATAAMKILDDMYGGTTPASVVQQLVQSGGNLDAASSVKGLTWNQLLIGYNNMASLWNQYFGSNPTAQQVQSMGGWTSDEIYNYVMDSPSSVSGLSNREYNNYASFLVGSSTGESAVSTGGGSTHTFSAGIDDSVLQSLDHAVKSGGTPSTTTAPKPTAAGAPG